MELIAVMGVLVLLYGQHPIWFTVLLLMAIASILYDAFNS